MVLLLDNFDSFTYNLVDYLGRAGVSCEVMRNDISPEDIDPAAYSALVISPGPGTPAQAGCLIRVLDRFIGKPILGICLGHQAIGEYFGAKLGRALLPMHGKVSIVDVDVSDPLFADIGPTTEVVRYHSLIISDLPPPLRAIAQTDRGELMALRHLTLPIVGIQFHPEAALSCDGQLILSNWVKQYGLADV